MGHSSNTGAIAGGTACGIVAISIVIVLFFYFQRRRRSRAQYAPPTGYGQAGAYNPQVSSRPVLGQETALSSLPGASTSLTRHYVRPLSLPPVALMCFSTDRTRATHLLSPGTKQLRTRLTTLLKHLPYRTPEIYTPLPPRPAPKRGDKRADYFLISPLKPSQLSGGDCAVLHFLPWIFHFRSCSYKQPLFPFFFEVLC